MPTVRVVRGQHSSRFLGFPWSPLSESESSQETVPELAPAPPHVDEDQERRLVEERSRQAYQEGFRAGESAARDGTRKEFAETVAQVGNTLNYLSGYRAKLRKEAESDLVELAFAIARRILQRELTADPDALLGVVSAALAKLQSQDLLRVRAHPGMEKSLKHFFSRVNGVENCQVVADPSLPAGGLILETSRGRLDASVESQLEEIQHGLVDRLR